MAYRPTLESLRTHPVPEWYHDAKLGIFVHWGLYSVPGWAPTAGAYNQMIAKEGWAAWFARNPYAEWYGNSLRIKGSPTYHYHAQVYGESFPYDQFAPLFNQASDAWDPDDWAGLFQRIGARYVVLTTKHHDGFLLWPSRHPNPNKAEYHARRDLVGELTEAVRRRGMRMGLYYSGGLDWTFNQSPVQDLVDILVTIPQAERYVTYVGNHWRELIGRYQPSILWNDIGYPAAGDLKALFAGYYNQFPEGVINDRFSQFKLNGNGVLRSRRVRALVARSLAWILSHGVTPPAGNHFDFRTPEYTSFSKITAQKWEATRGIGYSFGYNRNEGPEHCLSVPELVRSFVDIVSKNGNLLLDVGPMADGTIPDLQRERLVGLGQWLAVNGEAIFGTRPWLRAEGRTTGGTAVRFTHKGDALYAVLLDRPQGAQVTLPALYAKEGAAIRLLGVPDALSWRQDGEQLTISLPELLPEAPAYALRIAPWVEQGA